MEEWIKGQIGRIGSQSVGIDGRKDEFGWTIR